MDQSSFDRIARLLGGATTRRAGLGAALGGLLGLGTLDAAAKNAGRNAGGRNRRRRDDRKPAIEGPCGDGSRKDNICTRNSQCCTNICKTVLGERNKDGEGRCRCIRNGRRCTEDRNCCTLRCVDGICNGKTPPPAPVATGDPCTAADTCRDPNAACATYTYDVPEGSFCVLPRRALCSADRECASHDCTDGVCVSCSSPACGVPCDAIVCADCPHQTVQSAIDSAASGDIIDIGAGVYRENLAISRDLTLRACKGESVTIRNTDYGNRTVTVTGGASLTIINITIDGYSNYKSANYGGGITTDGNLTLAGTTTVRKGEWDQGGGIHTSPTNPTTLTVTDRSSLRDNAADTYGSAIWTTGPVAILVDEDASIRFNHADTYGTIVSYDGTTSVTFAGNALIDGNTGYGATGLYCAGNNPVVVTVRDNVVFSNNISGLGYGGALYMDRNPGSTNYDSTRRLVIQDNAKFIGNEAAQGGAIFTYMTQLEISGSAEISRNVATDGSWGGAVLVASRYAWSGSGAGTSITGNVRIEKNRASGKCGGIYVSSADVLVSGSATVSNNTATGAGGGICLRNRFVPATLAVEDTAAITANTASSGGGVWSDNAANTLTAVTGSITDNTPDNCAGGSISC